jgi:hypothetical protein
MGPERQERLPPQPAEIESLLERVRHQQLSEQDFGLLERLLRLLLSVARLLEQKQASLARLRRLLSDPHRIHRPLLCPLPPARTRSQPRRPKVSGAVMVAGAVPTTRVRCASAAPIRSGKREIVVRVVVDSIVVSEYSNAHPVRPPPDSSNSTTRRNAAVAGRHRYYPHGLVPGGGVGSRGLGVGVPDGMGDELENGAPQRLFSEQDEAVQAGFLDRAYESFGMGIQIRGARRQLHRLDCPYKKCQNQSLPDEK